MLVLKNFEAQLAVLSFSKCNNKTQSKFVKKKAFVN